MLTLCCAAFTLVAADPPTIKLHGTVALPDGSPAANAEVVGACWHSPTVRTKTDRDGKFELVGEFAGPANISVLTADDKHGGKLFIPAQSVRRRATESLLIKTTPAKQVEVVVKKDGKSAAKVQVAWSEDRPPQSTDEQGRVRLAIPSEVEGGYLYAWDPTRGVAGVSMKGAEKGPIQLDLRPTAKKTFKVIDEFDKPVKGLKVNTEISFKEGGWFSGECFPDSIGLTDANGEWSPTWTPAAPNYIRGEPKDAAWTHDGDDERTDDANPPTMHVRKSQKIKGVVKMPLDASPENLLVEASSVGPRSRRTSSAARVRADGSFELPVVSDHYFTIGIVDEKWTSPRQHAILFRRSEKPKELVLHAEYATILEIRVVAGKDKKPVANAFIQGGESGMQTWKDVDGKTRHSFSYLRQFAETDEQGIARIALSRESVKFRASQGTWDQEIEAKPPQSGPFEITFHKPFVDKMRIAGKISPPPAEPGRVELRGAAGDRWDSKPFDVAVAEDGSFKLETDEPSVRLLATDRIAKTSAVSVVTMETDSLVLPMIANGSYGGTAKTPDGDPIPGCEVTLFWQKDRPLFSQTLKADENGRFLFENVPSETSLWVQLSTATQPAKDRYHGTAYVERGERRLNAVDVYHELPADPAVAARNAKPASKYFEMNATDSRLWHAPSLVVAMGPGKAAAEVVKKLENDEDYGNAELNYTFPFEITAEKFAVDPTANEELVKRGWPVPTEGQVLFAAANAESKSLGHVVVKADDPDAIKKATAFLLERPLKKSPAIKAVEAAFAEAKKSNRRVFFQTGGLRCGPCYRFMRWIDQQRHVFEKDFVLLKLSNEHTDWQAAIGKLQLKPSDGIPWTAILDADGKVLATSDGPLGNIGFPSSGLGVKHFRKMLEASTQKMTNQEREALVKSLEKD
jgi:hypothetical protein